MTRVIDAKGLACPQPVVLTAEARKEAVEIIAIVDNQGARDEVLACATCLERLQFRDKLAVGQHPICTP